MKSRLTACEGNKQDKEWEDRLFVSESEIQKQYRRMQYMPSVKTAPAKTRETAEDQRLKLLKGKHLEYEKTIDPCAPIHSSSFRIF